MKRVFDFINDHEDLFCELFIILGGFAIVIFITDYFDKQYVIRHQQYVDINSDNLIEYDNCFEYSSKYYCYVNGSDSNESK